MDDPIGALTSYVAFLFSTTVHEAAQAILVAWRVFDEIFMPIFFFAVDRLYPEGVYG